MSEQEKPEPEIRGGNRPADYIPAELHEGEFIIPSSKFHGRDVPVAHEDYELEDGAESYGPQAEDDE